MKEEGAMGRVSTVTNLTFYAVPRMQHFIVMEVSTGQALQNLSGIVDSDLGDGRVALLI